MPVSAHWAKFNFGGVIRLYRDGAQQHRSGATTALRMRVALPALSDRCRPILPCAARQQARGLVRRQVDS